jgi:hypothetical protein
MRIEISENAKFYSVFAIYAILPWVKEFIPYNGIVDYVIYSLIFTVAVIGLKSLNTSTKILSLYIIYLLVIIEIVIAVLSHWWHG